jgi:outer membrane protein OmpA-like peptidoglycan-associated protein
MIPLPACSIPRRRLITLPALALLLFMTLLTAQAAVPAQDEADPLAAARTYAERAKQLGARGNLPGAWRTFDARLDAAADSLEAGTWTADTPGLAALEEAGLRLVNRAALLREVDDARAPLEDLLGRYDRSLRQIAALMDVDLSPALTGDAAAEQLLEHLERTRLRRQVEVDSLRVVNRRLETTVGGQVAAQDSVITALQVELSALRKQLWETELRAGVAEADRSAAETTLARRQQREDAVQQILGELAGEADAVLRPDGSIVIQVHGLDFGVGSASLAPGQGELMDAIAAAVGRFPGAELSIEGHTDDTGSRAANLRLSERRAATVAGGIERRLELPEGSLATVGHGPDRPVAPNSTAEGRARNRRIDIVITPRD